MKSITGNSRHRPIIRQTSSSTKIPWLTLLNRCSFLAAFIGTAYYCLLVAKGEYYKWGMPLFVSATVCKLLSTAPRIKLSNTNTHDSQQQKKQRGRNEGYYSLNYESRRGRGVGSGRILPTCYSRAKSYLQQSKTVQILGNIHQQLVRRLNNDNHYNAIFLSTIIVVLPCFIYFIGKVAELSLSEINHKKLANDFGKLGSAAFSFLLIPVSKHSPLLAALNLGNEVHMLRLHIAAGCVVLFGGICHGLYYVVYIWIELKGYTKWGDVFPTKECWSGLWARDYDKDCHEKLINLLGVVCGILLLVLGTSSLYWVRRRFYRVFYVLHVMVSISILFGLVMHYNKMIWYMAPSLLCYVASNVPVHGESLVKWWRQRRWHGEGVDVSVNGGNVNVSKVVCIPDSGGCVELTFRTNIGHHEAVLDGDGDGGGGGGGGHVANNTEDDTHEHEAEVLKHDANASSLQSFHNTAGKYIKLHVPELSAQSHPFTIFANPQHPNECVNVLFRPCGSFTKSLSKRLKALTMLPEMTPSEIENHHQLMMSRGGSSNGSQSRREKSCPKMLINGIRSATTDMFERVMTDHDRIVIIAGGVGIVSYISLLHAIRMQHLMAIGIAEEQASHTTTGNNTTIGTEGDDVMESVINNHRRAMNFDDDDDDDENNKSKNGDEEANGLGEGGDAFSSASSSHNNSKCITVHWMSRDEGLIRHVLEDYFEPFCHHEQQQQCGKDSQIMPSINIVVHHTSPHSHYFSSSNNIDNNNHDASNSNEPTTWEPSRQTQQQQEASNDPNLQHSSSTDAPFTSIASVYQGNKSWPSQNILPSVTYASIIFGGLWIVNYCYNNMQDKHTIETRPISILGIILLSIAVSVTSNAAVLGSQILYSKFCHFKYSKLKSSGSANVLREDANGDVDDDGEIECGQVLQQQQQQQQTFSSSSDNEHSESNPQSPSGARRGVDKKCHSILSITHSQGRPDMSAIVRDAIIVKEGKEEHHQHEFDMDESSSCFGSGSSCGTDVGIFMCGPKAMSDSVWSAIKQQQKEEVVEARGLCRGACTNTVCSNGRKPVAVYQEVFEL